MKKERKLLIYKVLIMILFLSGCQKEEDILTVTDIDGNVYQTITIGTKVWMVENLRVTRYNDGTPIPNVTDKYDWMLLKTGAYCNYNNDTNMVCSYGRLYNWYAINTNKLCPKGWHIPRNDEWPTFNSSIKSANGFPAVPGGYRYLGTFENIGNGGYWWTIDNGNANRALRTTVLFSEGSINTSMTNKSYGFSVRCVKD